MAVFSYQQQQLLQNPHHPHPPHTFLVIDSSSSSSLLFPNTTPPLPLTTLPHPHIYSDSNSNNNSSRMSGFLEEEPNSTNSNSNPAYLLSSSSSNNSGICVLLQNTPPPPNINMDHKINKRKYNNSKYASSSLNSNIPLSKDTREVIVPPNGKKQRKNMISSNGDDDGPMIRDDIEEKKKKMKKKRKKKMKICRGSSNNKKDKVESGKEEQVPTGYIHVRARRGQATDSHSLAERVRREKISERMKMLQALVPGCDKVTGKALMLDEIINYVQSLQNQVEFLSMKIASVNPMFYDFGIDLDALMVKPEGMMSSLEEPQQADVQQCYSPNQSTTNTLNTTPNNYSLPLLDTSTLLLLQQAQMPNILSESQPPCSHGGVSR